MTIKELKKKPLPAISADIAEQISNKENITLTDFDDKDDILRLEALQNEIGFRKFKDGSYLVSMVCPMRDITPEMIEWWFWWHPQKSERYQVWFPGEHYSVGYAKRDADYFNSGKKPAFKDNTQYPLEKIGGLPLPLRIDFVTAEEFGFSRADMERSNIPLIVCGHVSAFNGIIKHTEMAHIFKKTDNGLILISRFWLGKSLKNKLLRKFILTDKTAKSMAEHCCVEYRNLVEILPHLYHLYV